MDDRNIVPTPISRKLRIFAFDPSVAAQFDMADISEITLSVPWEKLKPGPIGEYIEVVDADPASGALYLPVDLDDSHLLAQGGHDPSEGNPQFHQQMVYAVAMTTIRHFEQALGRKVLWSTHREDGVARKERFVRRLRIYPHALRDRNAYYSPAKKALLFGYFPVDRKDRDNTPGTIVHTCLSHDIVAHEITHALLDGVHPRFNEPVNADVLAFHEAFSDIIALFQHFTYSGILRDQIARTRGDLETENMLGKLAQQFGRAAGRGDALRDALGDIDSQTGTWRLHQPDVRRLETTREPHARGAVLVAAVFGAFLRVYKARTRDLLRIASGGTGVLRAGAIHPDLAGRLAEEAARAATYLMHMCIRAIDYCPPVGITFGDFLRALVSADTDLNPEDPSGYRLAVVESFRAWGIHPRGMRSMAVESLLWPSARELIVEEVFNNPPQGETATEKTARLKGALDFMTDKSAKARTYARSRTAKGVPATSGPEASGFGVGDLDEDDRYEIWRGSDVMARSFWNWLNDENALLAEVIGIVFDNTRSSAHTGTTPQPLRRSIHGSEQSKYSVEIHSVRAANRRNPLGGTSKELVIEITQRRRGYFDRKKQQDVDAGIVPVAADERGDFTFRSGCTLLINPKTMEIRRVIRSAGRIDDDGELERVRRYLSGDDENAMEPGNAFQQARVAMSAEEPFALLHRGGH